MHQMPKPPGAGLRSLQPALQYIAGELPVDAGQARCFSLLREPPARLCQPADLM